MGGAELRRALGAQRSAVQHRLHQRTVPSGEHEEEPAMSTATQLSRMRPNTADATLTLGDDDALHFDVLAVTGEEELARLFRFDITVCVGIELADQIDEITFAGQRAALRLHAHDGQRRLVRGLISNAEFAGGGHSHVYFRLTLSPHTWSLTQRVNFRIFQEVNTPEIIRRVLADHGLDGPALAFALREDYASRDYCVQYNESDWNFISRLMEEEGMYCFYREHEDNMRLHIADGGHGHPDLAFGATVPFRAPEGRTPEPGTIYEFTSRRQLRPGQVSMTDYAAVKPSMPLDTAAQDAFHSTEKSLEVFQYPGEYRTRELGGRLARVRLEEKRCGHRRGRGRSTRVDLAPGRRFIMEGHMLRRSNTEYVVTRVRHHCVTPMAEQIGYAGDGLADGEPLRPAYENEFDVIPQEDVFRPARKTPQPRVSGPQTAVVVGPKGEEIYTDRY
ncbi:MAG: type VI secretion system tip protein VgrG, partial [Planctomycetota bacterium]